MLAYEEAVRVVISCLRRAVLKKGAVEFGGMKWVQVPAFMSYWPATDVEQWIRQGRGR